MARRRKIQEVVAEEEEEVEEEEEGEGEDKKLIKWTEEEEQLLLQLKHTTSLTFRQIAEKLGKGRSKYACCQKYHKLVEDAKKAEEEAAKVAPGHHLQISTPTVAAAEVAEEQQPVDEDEPEDMGGEAEPLAYFRANSKLKFEKLLSVASDRSSKYAMKLRIAEDRRDWLLKHGGRHEELVALKETIQVARSWIRFHEFLDSCRMDKS